MVDNMAKKVGFYVKLKKKFCFVKVRKLFAKMIKFKHKNFIFFHFIKTFYELLKYLYHFSVKRTKNEKKTQKTRKNC